MPAFSSACDSKVILMGLTVIMSECRDDNLDEARREADRGIQRVFRRELMMAQALADAAENHGVFTVD